MQEVVGRRLVDSMTGKAGEGAVRPWVPKVFAQGMAAGMLVLVATPAKLDGLARQQNWPLSSVGIVTRGTLDLLGMVRVPAGLA